MIAMHDLTKVYRTASVETTALNHVNIEVAEGEFIAIMGPSGCGKSNAAEHRRYAGFSNLREL